MSKRTTVITIAAVVMAAAFAAVALTADRIAEKAAAAQLHKTAAEKGIELKWSDLRIRLLHGSVRIDSLQCRIGQADSAFIDLQVQRLYAGRIHRLKLLRERVLRIDKAELTGPQIETCSPREAAEMLKKQQHDKTRTKRLPIARAEVKRVSIKDGRIAVSMLENKLQAAADSLCICLHEAAYDLRDSSLTFCDSLYAFSACGTDFLSTDGLFRLSVASAATADGGCLIASGIRGGNTDRPEKHALNAGKAAATWAQFDITELRTSPVNILRSLKQKEIKADTLTVQGNYATIYRNNQYPPRAPYPMPQEALAKVPVPIELRHADIALNKLKFSLTTDGSNAGTLELKDLSARLRNITNHAGSTIHTALKSTLQDGGSINVHLDLKNNNMCTFGCKTEVTNTGGGNFGGFLRTIAGVNANCNIHRLNMDCHGDKHNQEGTFCMQYDSLKIHIDKDSPIEKLGKLAGVANAFAPAVLVKSNPRHKGGEPQTYTTACTRNPWKPFPVYLFKPLGDGIVQTVLPPAIAKPVSKKMRQKNNHQ